MIPIENIRKTELKTADGWLHVLFTQIEPGETFRQFEPDGTPVEVKGKTEFKAVSHAAIEIEE